MRSATLTLLAQTCTTMGFPGLAALALAPNGPNIIARQDLPSNLPLSQSEGNSGPIPSLSFDPVDQFVNVAPGSPHQYVPPTSTDKRGPCPGLNAAANHGFLPHNGIPNIPQSECMPARTEPDETTLLTPHSCCWSPGCIRPWPRIWCCTRRHRCCFDWRPNSRNLVDRTGILCWDSYPRRPAHPTRRNLLFTQFLRE